MDKDQLIQRDVLMRDRPLSTTDVQQTSPAKHFRSLGSPPKTPVRRYGSLTPTYIPATTTGKRFFLHSPSSPHKRKSNEMIQNFEDDEEEEEELSRKKSKPSEDTETPKKHKKRQSKGHGYLTGQNYIERLEYKHQGKKLTQWNKLQFLMQETEKMFVKRGVNFKNTNESKKLIRIIQEIQAKQLKFNDISLNFITKIFDLCSELFITVRNQQFQGDEMNQEEKNYLEDILKY